MNWLRWAADIVAAAALAAPALAQGFYEIQVYGSELVPPRNTMIELHSNFTFEGSKSGILGALPTEHQLHETLEITRGFTEWFETGFYVFSSAQPGEGWQWVGDHIRPRFSIPERWRWPVGLSLSNEIGYQRPLFSPDTWTWEIRPIVDKKLGRWYLAFNPAFDKSLHGPSAGRGWEFSPDGKVAYDVTSLVAAGVEYYGALGPVGNFDPLAAEQQQIVPAVDLNLGQRWEFNFGVAIGLTRGTDRLLVKWILGRRFGN